MAAPTDLDDAVIEAVPKPEEVRAFLIDPGKGYAYKTGTSTRRHSLDSLPARAAREDASFLAFL